MRNREVEEPGLSNPSAVFSWPGFFLTDSDFELGRHSDTDSDFESCAKSESGQSQVSLTA